MSSNPTPSTLVRSILLVFGAGAPSLRFLPRRACRSRSRSRSRREAGAGEEAPKKTTLMDMIIGGGIFMIPIGILSIWMITLAVFSPSSSSMQENTSPALRDEIMGYMSEVKVRSAIDASVAGHLLPRPHGHRRLHQRRRDDPETLGRSKVEDAMTDFVVRREPQTPSP